MVQTHSRWKTFNIFEKKAQLYVDGAGLTNNEQNKKDDTSVNYFPKATYWRPLVSSAESVVKTTNQSFKNPRDPYIA